MSYFLRQSFIGMVSTPTISSVIVPSCLIVNFTVIIEERSLFFALPTVFFSSSVSGRRRIFCILTVTLPSFLVNLSIYHYIILVFSCPTLILGSHHISNPASNDLNRMILLHTYLVIT